MKLNLDNLNPLYDVVIFESSNTIYIEASAGLINTIAPHVSRQFDVSIRKTQIQIDVPGIYESFALAERIAISLEMQNYKVGRRLTNRWQEEHRFTQSFILEKPKKTDW